jgi:PAS domain S-box-containing protein
MSINESFLVLLTFMVSLTVQSLALSADVAMRRASEENLRRTQGELDRRVKERTAAPADANIHLQEARRLANLGSWSWDLKSDRVVWSDRLFEIYGLARRGFKGTIDAFLSFVHPEDRERVEDSIDGALRSGHAFSHEEHIVRPDRGVRLLQSIGEVVRDETGAPVRMLGCLDVTDRIKAERALRQSEQSYRLLLRSVRDYAIYMLGPQGCVLS